MRGGRAPALQPPPLNDQRLTTCRRLDPDRGDSTVKQNLGEAQAAGLAVKSAWRPGSPQKQKKEDREDDPAPARGPPMSR